MIQLLILTLTKSTPLLLAASGGLISELSGVINFALEGMMLAGAFGAVWVSFATGSPWIGLLGGILGGIFIGLLHGVASLVLKANQIVSSIALNLVAAGLSGLFLNQVFDVYGTSPSVNHLPDMAQVFSMTAGFSGSRPGVALEGISVLVLFALCISILLTVFFRWSRWGLRIRACGENPLAANAAGLPVFRIRFFALTASGALAGMGGAYLSIGELSQFVEHMTQGRGYLAIAAIILGRWRPVGVLMAALLFGLGEALSEWMAIRWSQLPNQVFMAMPYILCFFVLIFQIGKTQPPSALGKL